MQKYLMMVAVFLVVSMARAGDGTWISTSNGNWGASENWAGGTNADGSGFTADFTTIDIPSDVTVTLDTNKTIGVLKFGDTGVGTAGSWILAGDNTLTLAGTPTITVNALGAGKSVTISSSVAGSSGLTKTGVGTLTLNGSNTFSGSMTQADGWMYLSGSATNALNALTLGNQNSDTITPVLSITSGTVTYSGRMGLGGATGARGFINI